MSTKIRVCFWTTSFQADVWQLAHHLSSRDDFEIVVALENADAYRGGAMQTIRPLSCRLLERETRETASCLGDFAPDITIVDNHFPRRRLSKRLFVLWHGFGWKGPNDVKEFKTVHKSVKRLTGVSGMRPNTDFLWQCFGPTDVEHRHAVSGFARENLRSLGAAMTDGIVAPLFSREDALAFYPPGFSKRRIALLAFTWHYGTVFSHWGDELRLFRRLLDELDSMGFAVVLRMHDRRRYDPGYLGDLQRIVCERGHAIIKYSGESRDNLLDIAVADLMISNFSSILNYFYATGRPSLHVYPVGSADEAFLWRTWSRGRIKVKETPSADYVWKLPPEENGGLMARSFAELLEHLDLAARDPDCCVRSSKDFIARHMAPVDGNTCQRIARELIVLHRR
jgi:hypothetical protein